MIQLEGIHIRRDLVPGDPGFIAYMHGDLYARECGYGARFEAYVPKDLKEYFILGIPHAGMVFGYANMTTGSLAR